MLTNNQLSSILKSSVTVRNLYDKEIDSRAHLNRGEYKLDEHSLLEISNKAFNTICKESTINVSWNECCVIFDLIDRV